ncbi:MAG: RNA-binding protein [Paracoccaceae bacterium]
MSRGGRDKDRAAGPERRCVVTGEVGPATAMVRFAEGPDGAIVPDVLGKLGGRGFHVAAARAHVDALRGGHAARALKGRVTVPEGLSDLVEAQLAARLVGLISMARKAGLAVCGFEKVKTWLGERRIRVLLQAEDGSGRGKAKLWTPEGARYFDCLTAEELGRAFGRDAAVHAALATGALPDRVVEEARRLRGFRESDGGNVAAAKGD